MARRRRRTPQFNATGVPTEHEEQAALIRRVRDHEDQIPQLELLYSNANGGYRTRGTAMKMKAEGTKPGIPDLFLPVARGPYHGLYIEMKATKGGSLTKAQKAVIPLLEEQGYRVEVCKGMEKAWGVLMDYLKTPTEES